MTIRVRLTPRGGRDAIDGVAEGLLVARVASAPVDGAANASLTRLLAHALDCPPSAVHLVAGSSARIKTVRIQGLSADDLRSRWPGIRV